MNYQDKAIIISIALLAFVAGIYLHNANRAGNPVGESLKPVEFSFPDTSGQIQSLSQWRGKVVVINFWATWCPPCRKEIPGFIKLQGEFQQNGLQVLGIALEDSSTVSGYVAQMNFNYPVLVADAAGSELSRQYGNVMQAVPFTVVLDQFGQLKYSHPGELSFDRLVEIVTPLLAVKR